MDRKLLKRRGDYVWLIERTGKMRVDGIIYASEHLIAGMDDKVAEQVRNVASLPGIVKASYAMPDAHWGYGFAIGGVAAFDPEEGGVISAGGVGFDIACGVRTLNTGLVVEDIEAIKTEIAEKSLFHCIPAGVGSTGNVHLGRSGIDDVLAGGAKWAVDQGYGTAEDLRFIEENGCMKGADPSQVSDHAKSRHDFLKRMVQTAPQYGLELPDRELACSPVNSPVGQSYLGAMRAAINCALANRQILMYLVREAFETLLPKANIKLLYDVSHNTCKTEEHVADGRRRRLFVHRKGATRACSSAGQWARHPISWRVAKPAKPCRSVPHATVPAGPCPDARRRKCGGAGTSPTGCGITAS